MVLASLAVVAAEERPLSVWRMPQVWPVHQQMRQTLMAAIRRGDIPTMEKACRQALEAIPGDATWHYNLACALAYRATPDAALEELGKAIDFGFRDADVIAKDDDLKRIAQDPRFAALVQRARETAGLPVAGRPILKPTRLEPGGTLLLTATNTTWNFDLGLFETFVDVATEGVDCGAQAAAFCKSRADAPERPLVAAWLKEGSAGNAGDFYFNRDGYHSAIDTGDYPYLSSVRAGAEAAAAGLGGNHPDTVFRGRPAVFGNISRARLKGPYWRSYPRASMTDPGLAGIMHTLYRNNQFWVIPAHKDIGDALIGDVFPGVAPFQFVTMGSSWSDLPYLRVALAASAAFPRLTKQAILRRGLLGPTLQWLFRRTRPGVDSEELYLSGSAHPTAFAPYDLDPVAMVKRAHGLKPGDVPPAVDVTLVNSKLFPVKYPVPLRDFPDPAGEILYATPSAVCFVLRALEGVRTFLFHAEAAPERDPSAVFAWRVVRGDASAVKIERPLGETVNGPEQGFAQITLDRTKLTSRVDLAVFVKSQGSEFGAPSIVSFMPVAIEKRTYDEKGRLLVADWTNPDARYGDPFVALPRSWKDAWRYDSAGKALGFTRVRPETEDAFFLPNGDRVVSKNADGTPKTAVRVKYVPRDTGNRYLPPELTFVDDGEPYAVGAATP